MRQMASDPIKTAHDPKATESHRISAAINCSPQAKLGPKPNKDTGAQIRPLPAPVGIDDSANPISRTVSSAWSGRRRIPEPGMNFGIPLCFTVGLCQLLY